MTPTSESADDLARPTAPDTEETEPPRREWVTPSVEDLPKLTDLTLQTGGGIEGGGGVFP